MKRFYQLEDLQDFFDDSELLLEVVRILSDEQFNVVYKHIVEMWDIKNER
jgi:hypothetical protein